MRNLKRLVENSKQNGYEISLVEDNVFSYNLPLMVKPSIIQTLIHLIAATLYCIVFFS